MLSVMVPKLNKTALSLPSDNSADQDTTKPDSVVVISTISMSRVCDFKTGIVTLPERLEFTIPSGLFTDQFTK